MSHNALTIFRINTSASVDSKQLYLPLELNTYEKEGGGDSGYG
jgi:hypothetical protein